MVEFESYELADAVVIEPTSVLMRMGFLL